MIIIIEIKEIQIEQAEITNSSYLNRVIEIKDVIDVRLHVLLEVEIIIVVITAKRKKAGR